MHWPAERDLLEHLRAEGAPRLLLVGQASPPPDLVGCEEDWVRLPADERDLEARVWGLAARSLRHRPGPHVAGDGRLRYGAHWIPLSPIEHRLATVLAGCFGEVVDSEVLAGAARPGEGINEAALRVHLTRLRRRLRSIGLEIQNVRGRGYLMEHATG
ncbi:MAG: winged helix-turn-helix domain-containing protein [Acidimicrobiia bacterium]|nr:winged helix-turn-helix domain-containing protein [Acidimicrobiia bacterium]